MDNPPGRLPGPESDLVRRAAAGDPTAWAVLMGEHRERLRRLVAARLDSRLAGRLDASDVIQEVSVRALSLLPRYQPSADLPFFLWLRWLARQTLVRVHREHLGVKSRDPGREVRFQHDDMPAASSAALAAVLLGGDPRPSEAVSRAEKQDLVRAALDSLDPADRELIFLRHFEELTTLECARVLGVDASTASRRYHRALRRFKTALEALPGGGQGLLP